MLRVIKVNYAKLSELQNLCEPLRDFARYLTVTQGRQPGTVEQYLIDLMLFFRFIIAKQRGLPLTGEEFDNIDIGGVDYELIKTITRADLLDYLYFTAIERSNSARTRARKLTSLRSFYRYLTKEKIVTENIAKDIDSPKQRRTLPKYLTLDESELLLDTTAELAPEKTRERDYAILTLFLNCGMRLSELVGLNLSDIAPDLSHVRVRGKGAKERVVYLNDACREALLAYLKVRQADTQVKPGSADALFLSSRHRRISRKTVQWMVYRRLAEAGLESKNLSVHKLRHTAATLMYQTGKVDIRVLKDILGHEQLSTTQIYTHVANSAMQRAVEANPLAKKRSKGESE
ncbi:MAG TPA: tyrosine recombinase XerC [Bacillota bacterium]|nr:tyrosine recombinase XerC [Clostridiales bacterium]HPT85651.1 tyrosine recombinase XerC [Bacillota bacterium]